MQSFNATLIGVSSFCIHYCATTRDSARFLAIRYILCLLAGSAQAQHMLESTEEHHHLHVKKNHTHMAVRGGCNYVQILDCIS